jgi:ATP-binding cassette, subfamily C (CFTR/MRP), member 1
MDMGLYLRVLVTAWTDLETSLSAVARIREFSSTTPSEGTESACEPSPGWPDAGSVKFSRLVAAYSEDGLPVLKGIDLDIEAGEKVGICGRTGSGKSSLVACLFGLLEQQAGQILIDGIATDSISLSALRSKIIALPQEPFFLPGTLKENLVPWEDPLRRESVSQERMRSALIEVNLLAKFEDAAARAGISPIWDLPLNNIESLLSQGERQLFCLARALLMDGKIVVLDEVTSRYVLSLKAPCTTREHLCCVTTIL